MLALSMFDVFTLIVAEKDYLRCFAYSHGGTDCGSVHKPFLASRGSFSSPSSTVSPDAYLHTTKMRQP